MRRRHIARPRAINVAGREAVGRVGRRAFVHDPDGIGRSRLTTQVLDRTLATLRTSHSWNTALKLMESCGGTADEAGPNVS